MALAGGTQRHKFAGDSKLVRQVSWTLGGTMAARRL
ncbi:hypothetical protein SNOG_09341 [Parastagonospora nodorum SN15]|uniref:Uncharacterized protein n=1 Tax=Phaeosphaeria nodorum (strain SN15 / ATCC MYA-4574 / FGSC 10173) TaxID=321614 RepID=Q0UFX3_PHANO|nr:hypothetical protein SNOG_09341 [Parastagonospora nodorum SN15]EAT83533.1 hypothetical protein SNOG_09341 [Parastagonospora nodorum SN15]